VVKQVWVDNCKVAVLSRAGGAIVFNPRYLDLPTITAFNPGLWPSPTAGKRAGRKRRGLCQKELPPRLALADFQAVNPAARYWLETVANVRFTGRPKKHPGTLRPGTAQTLHPLPYQAAIVDTVRVNNQFRITVDGNRYSVPCQYASSRLTLKRSRPAPGL